MDVARRPLWKACLLGATIGIIESLILLAAALGLGLLTTKGGSYAALGFAGIMDFLCIFGAPIFILLSTVFGTFLLRQKRSWLYSFLILPATVIPSAVVVCIVGIYIHHKLDDRRLAAEIQMINDVIPHEMIVNYSQNPITNVRMLPFSSGYPTSSLVDLTEYPPLDRSKDATPEVEEIHGAPDWTPMTEVEVYWARPAHGGAFKHLQGGQIGNSIDLRAKVPVALFQGRKHKGFEIIFLPDDKVRVDVVDMDKFDGKVNMPADNTMAVKGVAVKP